MIIWTKYKNFLFLNSLEGRLNSFLEVKNQCICTEAQRPCCLERITRLKELWKGSGQKINFPVTIPYLDNKKCQQAYRCSKPVHFTEKNSVLQARERNFYSLAWNWQETRFVTLRRLIWRLLTLSLQYNFLSLGNLNVGLFF